jgi:hypothetical protein
MSFLDFNDAQEQKAIGGLIPDNTPVFIMTNLRAGGGQADKWMLDKVNDGGPFSVLDFEFTIVGGEYDKRKLWSEQIVIGNGSDGHATAVNITRGMLRALIEAALGINPKDPSPEAQAARSVPGFHFFHLLKVPAMIGVEKGRPKDKNNPNGEKHPDRNNVRFIITPDKPEYVHPGQQEPRPPAEAVVQPRQQGGGSGGGGGGGSDWGGQGSPQHPNAPQAANSGGAAKPAWAA